MRRARLGRLAVVAALVASTTAALPVDQGPLVQLPLGVGGFQSANITYLGTLVNESPSIGGRVLEVDGQPRLYTTGAKGLSIYDLSNPALPALLGLLPLPHFQNEDVDVSDDGSRVIISVDTAGADTRGRAGLGGIRIVDTSNPANPVLRGFISSSNHTTTCADPKCEWLYGSSGRIFDATNPDAIVDTGKRWAPTGVSGAHALNRDEAGIMISDTSPRLVLDVSDPANPKEISRGSVAAKFGPDGLLQHNNVRPNALEWTPREEGDDDPRMRAGELLIGNSESNVRPSCGGNAGGLSTWSMVDFDKGTPITQLEVFRPINGTYTNGDPRVNALGCSGHWFTVDGNTVAASWYEHGVRVIDVDPATGKFTQKGFFQPVVTEAGAAHWVIAEDGTRYILSMDYARGIDILRYDPQAPVPSQEEFDASWLANLGVVGPNASAERYLCRLGVTQQG
ncbi:MAG: LVIVD repeat-containing protein [Actinomycetes bacterium]